jgi:long-chain acyl-CoA synthetase
VYKTVYEAFHDSVVRYPECTALRYKDRGIYRSISYKELDAVIDAVAAKICSLGIRKGDTVAIMSYNRPEWAMTDLAALKIGAVVVPIYYMPGHILPPANVKYILNDSKAKMLFVENRELLSVVDQIRSEIPHLKHIWIIDDTGIQEPGLLRFKDIETGSAGERRAAPEISFSSDELATIVYTSGTTGDAKGVMLTHANIVSNTVIAIRKFNFTPDDVVISYLPIGHMFERTCGYYSVLFAGGSIGYAQDLTTVANDAEEIKPTILLAVPRVIEKAYNTAVDKISGSSPVMRALVAAAIRNLNEKANLKFKKKQVPLGLKIKCFIYDKLVASKFKRLGGGRIRVIVAGSAPLNRQIAKILYVLGFNIVEGYGLTEAAPVVSSNTVEDNILGTVGKPFDGIEIRIGDNSEILVRGPNIMKGYHNKPEETARTIDNDGWLHTGDQGKFDEHGHLVITGRIKELIVTSGGKKIAPAAIEAKITFSPYIEQAVVCGDNRQYLIALIVPNKEALRNHVKDRGITYDSDDLLFENAEVKHLLKQEVDQAIADLPSFEKPKMCALLNRGFTVENGMLTQTLKLKRSRIQESYQELYETMYKDKPAAVQYRNIIYL